MSARRSGVGEGAGASAAWAETSDVVDSGGEEQQQGQEEEENGLALATTTTAEEKGDEDPLYTLFAEHCAFGQGHLRAGPPMMDSRTCQKLARDCGVTGPNLTKVDIDLIFVKVRGRGATKIDFAEFVEVTRQWALRKGMSHEELVDILVRSPGPTLNNVTLPDATKFRDEWDRSFASSTGYGADTSRLDLSTNSPAPRGAAAAASEELHPDWYQVQNPNPQGPGEEVYYVNRFTNETTWDRPVRRLALTNTNRTSAASAGAASPAPSSSTNTMGGGGGGGRRSTGAKSEGATPYKSIFDKLTDHRLYTGTHKFRYDPETGKGLGKAGRDSPAKGFSLGYSFTPPKGNFHGNTNTGTDVRINDLSEILTRR